MGAAGLGFAPGERVASGLERWRGGVGVPPTCLTCRLPSAVRQEAQQDYWRGVPLREISARLAAKDHAVSRDALHRHFQRCVAPPEDADVTHDPAGLSVALVVRDRLGAWPTLAQRIADDLASKGYVAAARVVVSGTPESMRVAIETTEGTGIDDQLEARALAAACREVLPEFPQVASRMAHRVRLAGLDDLADALEQLPRVNDDPQGVMV